jgi:hypothetical protein
MLPVTNLPPGLRGDQQVATDRRRILVIGDTNWTSVALTREAIQYVMDTFRGPYTLVCTDEHGAAEYAALAAKTFGTVWGSWDPFQPPTEQRWDIEKHALDVTKCAPDCPSHNHRRPGGPAGDWCPAAKSRLIEDLAGKGVDLVIVLRHGRTKAGATRRDRTRYLKDTGIGIRIYTQTSERGRDQSWGWSER